MITLKSLLAGLFTGLILGAAWLVFIDSQVTSHDAFPGTHVIAPLMCTLAGVLINFANPQQIEELTAVRVWIFIWFTVQAVCIGNALFILSTQYPADDNYPGVGMLLQTILCVFATMLFLLTKEPAS